MCVRVRACMCGVGKEGETERESGERDLCNQMIGGGGGGWSSISVRPSVKVGPSKENSIFPTKRDMRIDCLF